MSLYQLQDNTTSFLLHDGKKMLQCDKMEEFAVANYSNFPFSFLYSKN